MQDTKNRQNSLECSDEEIRAMWEFMQKAVSMTAIKSYREALRLGIAKEQARALLPEGLTLSRMYVNGNLRSWLFYLKQRLDPSTQKEHRQIAQEVLQVLRGVAPITMDAFFRENPNTQG